MHDLPVGDRSRTLRLAIFDLDGTLVESDHVMRAAMEHICGIGTPRTRAALETLEAMQGHPLERVFAAIGLDEQAVATYREQASRRTHEVRLVAGMRRLCADVADSGVRLAILTGKDARRTEQVLRHLDLASMFDPVIACDSGLPPKPSGVALEAICRAHAVSPGAAVYVGDAEADRACAHAAAVPFVHCAWRRAGVAPSGARPGDRAVRDVGQLRTALLELGWSTRAASTSSAGRRVVRPPAITRVGTTRGSGR